MCLLLEIMWCTSLHPFLFCELTDWGWVMQKCVRELGHYLNQYWNIVNPNLWNKLQWNLKQKSHIFIQENVFENAVRKIAILFRPQCVNSLVRCSRSWLMRSSTKNDLFVRIPMKLPSIGTRMENKLYCRVSARKTNASVLAMELCLSCTNPSIWHCRPRSTLVQIVFYFGWQHQAIAWTNRHFHNDCYEAFTWGSFNSMAPGRFEWNFRYVMFKLVSVIDG